MFAALADLVARHGYAMVVLFVGAEGLGIPLPGEGALVIAAAIASRGRLSLSGVVLAATAGAILGGTGGYWLGRLAGPVILRRGPVLDRARRFFDRYGAPSVFAGRFVALLRTLVGMLAGVSGMSFVRFSVYNALGGLVWASAVAGSGFLVGRSLPRLRGLGRAGLLGALFVSVLAGLAVGWRWFRANRTALAGRASRLGRPYLVLHLAIGLLCGLGTIVGFGAVTENVLSHHSLTPFDTILATWLEQNVSPLAARAAAVAAIAGGPGVLALLGAGVGVLLLARRRWSDGAVWTVAVVGAAVLDVVVGLVVRRPPAPHADTGALVIVGLGGGDAVGSLVVYGLLAWLAARRLVSPWARGALGGAGALVVLAVGLGRLIVGAQFFSPLLTGSAAGLVWLTACLTGLELACGGGASPLTPERLIR